MDAGGTHLIEDEPDYISLCLTTIFLYDMDCEGCQRGENGQKRE